LAENILMITRFTYLGLLFILLFFSCKTTNSTIFEEDRVFDSPKEAELSSEPTIEERVNLLIDKYINDPLLLIDKILLVTDSTDNSYYPLIARLYLSVGDYLSANKYITTALEVEYLADNLEILAMSQMGLGDNYSTTLENILILDDKNIFAINTFASDSLVSKELNKAEEYLNKSYNIDPENSNTLLLLGDLALARVNSMGLAKKKVLSLQQESTITAYYKRALKYYLDSNQTTNPNFYVKLSAVYKKLGKKLKAVQALDRSIELEPDNVWNYYDRGKIYFYMGESQLALPDFKKAYDIDPNNFFVNVFLARSYFINNNLEESLLIYNKVLEMNPQYTPAYKNYSILNYILGDKTLSLNYLIRIYNKRLDPDKFIPLFLVDSLIEAGRDKDSKKTLENLVKNEKNVTMKGIYKYYLNPSRVGDQVLTDALAVEDDYLRMRYTYYVSQALLRDGVKSLSETLLLEVAESNLGFEAKLAKYKLGDKYE